MDNVIKSFIFESEGIQLVLNIKKELHKGCLKMFIDGNVNSNNTEITIDKSTNFSSKNIALKYKNTIIFWISTNDWKGLRWENYRNETKIAIYRDVKEMKERYIEQREFITVISNYFYDCIKNYKRIKILYETSLNEIISDDE